MKKIVFLPLLLFFLFSSCAQRNSSVSILIFGKDFQATQKNFQKSKEDEKIASLFLFPQAAGEILSKKRASVSVEFSFDGQTQKDADFFELGFLQNGDFSSKEPQFSSRVSGRLSETHSLHAKIEILIPQNVEGIFVRTIKTTGLSVNSVQIVEPKIGVDLSSHVPIFAFDSAGGNLLDATTISFSKNRPFEKNSLPVLKVRFRENASSDLRALVSIGGEKFSVRKPVDSAEAFIPLSAANREELSPISVLEGGSELSSIMIFPFSDSALVKNGFVLTPIRLDPGLIMYYPKKNWRGKDYELFEWDRFPGVLVMDILDYDVQNDFFRRIAFFVEKAGYRGKLLSDDFLADKHAYNAHDYRAESLAEFFEKARIENFPLNEKELLLKEILAKNGVIKVNENGEVSAGRGAVISISQESTLALRTQFVAHEGWHGIFFVDEDFRNFVDSTFEKMDKRTREYLIRYFQVTPSLNYDVRDSYLLRNEFMAYMLQKPLRDIAKYFIDMAGRKHSQENAKVQADYILETDARGFVEAASELDRYVKKRWNLNAGRVWLVN